jgi:signal peptidase II
VRVLWLSAAVILVDQITKLLVKGFSLPWLGVQWTGMPYGASRPLLGETVRLTYIENPGMAFGIDVGGKLFFSLFTLAASIAIAYYLFAVRRERFAYRAALALILGGAVGNLIDRMFYGVLFGDAALFYGKVVDFLDVEFFDINFLGYQLSRWPVFNVADSAVTVGMVLLLFFHGSVRTATAETPLPDTSTAANDRR